MKNIILYFSLFFAVTALQAQNETHTKATAYEQGMNKASQLRKEGKSWEAANAYERIAAVETDKWLPAYYVAEINVINSFTEKKEDKLSAQLKKAQDFINRATAISQDNPELLVLQAQLYTAWIVYDGRKYGMKYSQKASALYHKAETLAPENPRVILANAEWEIGSAKYFGKSSKASCKDIRRAINLFPTFKPEEAFYPTSGEDRAKQILNENCQ